jgi:hypothetical protein
MRMVNVGFFFRKSMNAGPVRVNMSKKGAGASFGFPGFRIGISADGRKYLRLSIPGTGIGWTKYF